MTRARWRRWWRAFKAPLLVLAFAPLLGACASNPFVGPSLPASWYVLDPPIAAAYGYGGHYPCTYVYPYFHGYDANGEARCTVRPYDVGASGVDALDMP